MDDEMKRLFGEGTVLSLRRLTCRVRGLLTNYHNVQPAKVNLNHERSAKRPETGQAVHQGCQPRARPRHPSRPTRDRSTLGDVVLHPDSTGLTAERRGNLACCSTMFLQLVPGGGFRLYQISAASSRLRKPPS